ncbi:hypothetical protein IVB08_00280 [Bradyrhizobium sp. 173]|uniref:hypothetical protein n=1 Tax=Bradyrhizobium sp. 173 TaxID=2782644 RepID=UPI001FFB6C29|nr:hypothetical protein [Bradyrhizobium sp. 173]MCK1562447.1 hypothetical protein [Bradyrhizobium sp. 173]
MTNWEKVEAILNVGSAICAMMAAKVWLEASMLKIPPHTSDSYEGNGPFSDALNLQSKKNAVAASWAAGAALSQSVALTLHIGVAYVSAFLKA